MKVWHNFSVAEEEKRSENIWPCLSCLRKKFAFLLFYAFPAVSSNEKVSSVSFMHCRHLIPFHTVILQQLAAMNQATFAKENKNLFLCLENEAMS